MTAQSLFFSVLTILVLFTLTVEAHAAGCKRSAPRASYNSELKPVEYIRTESVGDLTGWQMGHSITAKKVLGVGGGSIGTKLRARYEMIPVKNNLYCVTPVEIRVVFYAAPQIHVASNFARGSCEYSEVLAHEQKHITVLRKFQREYRDNYNDFFQDTARSLPAPTPVPLEEVETEKKKTTAYVMDELNTYTQEMMAELNERQRTIDTREEYERVISKCNNWEKKISGRR